MLTAKPMTIDRFRRWRANGRTSIPWGELEATVIEVAALEQVVRDSAEPMLKRALRAEQTLNDLDTRVRLVLTDLRDAKPEGLKEAMEQAIRDLHEAIQRVVKLAALKENR